MRRLTGLASGIWEFVAGDDWVTAAGVVLALALTALIGDRDAAWFVVPLTVAFLLTLSIWREARRRREPRGTIRTADYDG